MVIGFAFVFIVYYVFQAVLIKFTMQIYTGDSLSYVIFLTDLKRGDSL